MLTSVRSVRPTIVRMSMRAHSSMRGLLGKQKRYSTPSALRILAIAADTFISVPARALFRLGQPTPAAPARQPTGTARNRGGGRIRQNLGQRAGRPNSGEFGYVAP